MLKPFFIGWITFLVAALLQGCLLIMCITWKIRQRKLGIDDFGKRVGPDFPPLSWSEPLGTGADPAESPTVIWATQASAVEASVETDEQTALLAERNGGPKHKTSWYKRFGRR